MSCVKSLDEDIMKLFDSYKFFDDNIGDPRSLYQEVYPNLSHLRSIYFQDLLEKIDLGANSKFFNWFDDAFTQLIHKFIPMRANFLGVNYVIESHALERSKYVYLNGENQYTYTDASKQLSLTSVGAGEPTNTNN